MQDFEQLGPGVPHAMLQRLVNQLGAVSRQLVAREKLLHYFGLNRDKEITVKLCTVRYIYRYMFNKRYLFILVSLVSLSLSLWSVMI